MTGLRGGKNPKRETVVESHPFGFAQGRLLRKGRARMGHPRGELAQESGRLGLCQRAPPVTSFSADRPELFAQGQALPLIRRSYADAVNLFGRLQQSHVR